LRRPAAICGPERISNKSDPSAESSG
jgi:hypothetical protein